MNGRRGDVALGALIAIAARWKGSLKVGWLAGPAFVGAIIGYGLALRVLHSSAAIVFAVILAAVILAAVIVEALPGRAGNCQCGHPRDSHQHYRPGSDCSACHCLRFQR